MYDNTIPVGESLNIASSLKIPNINSHINIYDSVQSKHKTKFITQKSSLTNNDLKSLNLNINQDKKVLNGTQVKAALSTIKTNDDTNAPANQLDQSGVLRYYKPKENVFAPVSSKQK